MILNNLVDRDSPVLILRFSLTAPLIIVKMQFNHFQTIRPWELSIAMANKPRKQLAKIQLF